VTALEGKRALVIGAGSGIGRAVARRFADEGARVAALEIDPAKCAVLEKDVGGLLVVEGDATSWDANRRAADATIKHYGGLDVLVNCVGRFDFYRGIDDLGEDELDRGFDEAFQTNVRSQLLSVKLTVDELRRNHGSIVLTGSTSSFYPGRGGVLYVATKFAVRGIVLALAHELAPKVRVNGVAPGGTLDTDLRGLDALGERDRHLPTGDGRADDLRARTPLQVALTPADHAASYVFLASDASKGITGTFVHPDGGMSIK